MSSGASVKLIELFERATSESLREPDYGLNLEIADRMNSRRRQQFLFSCVEGIEYFKQLLKSSDLHTIQLTMDVIFNQLLETCVKNCGMHFHKYVNNRDLLPSLVQLLKRRRKKLTLVDKMISLYKDKNWRPIEDRVLALIQLWADTFMMEEDTYPSFMKWYRELRKEKMQFPPRNSNERYMIKFEGQDSPAFELAEMESQLNNDAASNGIVPQSRSRHETGVRSQQSYSSSQQNRQEQEEEEPKLTKQDIAEIKTNLPLLEEIISNAQTLRQLQEPHTREVIRRCRRVQKKLMLLASFRACNYTDEADTMDLLTILDYVNDKMEMFKKAIAVLKRGGTNHEVLSVFQASKLQQGDDLDEDFLELPALNPLDNLDKYEEGYIERKCEEVQKKLDDAIYKPAQEVEEEEYIEAQQEVKLHEPVDLLFDDFEPPQNSKQTGFNPPQNDPPQYNPQQYENFNPNQKDTQDDDPFGLGGITFDEPQQTNFQNPQQVPSQQIPQQMLPQQLPPQQIPSQQLPSQQIPLQQLPPQQMPLQVPQYPQYMQNPQQVPQQSQSHAVQEPIQFNDPNHYMNNPIQTSAPAEPKDDRFSDLLNFNS